MKNLILIIFCISSFSAFADCSGHGLNIFPNKKRINKNSIFIIEGHLQSQKIINGLNIKYPIYLESENEKIKLVVNEIFIGQAGLTQAILSPSQKLTPGIEYSLKIDNLPKEEKLIRYNSKLRRHESITFIANSFRNDIKAPILDSISEVDNFITHFGCGDAMGVVFSIGVTDTSEYFVKTKVTNLQTGEITTYCLLPTQNQITIGFGMCSGAFLFDGENYLAEFDIIDSSGNIKKWNNKPIPFKKPTKDPMREFDKWRNEQNKK